METKEIILGQTIYEVSRFYQKDKQLKDVISDHILHNLARENEVDELPREAV